MDHTVVHRYPFLRLLLPLIAGIACGDILFGFGGSMLPKLFFYALPASLLSLLFAYHYRFSLANRWMFGLFAFIFVFLSGVNLVTLRLSDTSYSFSPKEEFYRVTVESQPELRPKSVKCKVKIVEQWDSLHTIPINKNALLYLAPDSVATNLAMGSELLLYTRFKSPAGSGNPDEFDYSSYLLHKDVSGTAYVYTGKFKQLKSPDNYNWVQHAQRLRIRMMDYYRKLGFEGDELALLAALTLGDKGEVSDQLRESYSVAGASHLLAISGMHIGIVCFLISSVLFWMPKRWRWIYLLRNLIIIICLWSYAYLIGFAPSAVRAVTMLSLLLMAQAFQRQSFTLNTLFATAFFMLLVNPTWLFDIGFQLSFVAVLALLTLQPMLYQLLPTHTKIVRGLWNAITVTLAAQIGTAPLICYYFSRFSTYFLLSGIVLVTLIFIIMYAVAFMLLLAPLPTIQAWIVVVVKWLLSFLNSSTAWIEHLPLSSLDGIYIYKTEVAFFYLFIFLLYWFFKQYKVKTLLQAMLVILFAMIFRLGLSYVDRPQTQIVLYNQRVAPAIHCISADGRSWMVYGDSLPHQMEMHRLAGRYWSRLHLQSPQAITADYKTEEIQVFNQIVNFAGHRIALVTDKRWGKKKTDNPLTIDYLYLSQGYKGTIAPLMRLFNTGTVVFDSSISDYRLQRYRTECDTLGLSHFSLSDEGSLVILPRK